MDKPAKLREVFSKITDAADPIWDCGVLKLSPAEGANALSVVLCSPDVLTQGQMENVQAAICKAYGLSWVGLKVEYAMEHLTPAAAEMIRARLAEKYPSAAGALREAEMELEGTRLRLRLKESWQLTRVQHLERQWEQESSTVLRMPVQLDIIAPEATDDFEARRQEELARLSAEMPAAPAPAFSPKPEKKRSFIRKRDPQTPIYKPSERDDILFGKPVTRELTPLKDVTLDSGRVAVSGTVYLADIRKLNGIDKTVVFFEFYDGTGSLRASKMLPDEEAKELIARIKPGTAVLVQGQMIWSKYENDIQLNPSAILKIETKARTDEAADKRVELHLHTTMSAMDSVCDVGRAVETAAGMGHRAIAVTDHGVVQAFPDAMKAAKGKNIKILYGVEAYCVDDLDRARILRGRTDTLLDGEAVVFDLETTGLSAVGCEIIEIGALLVADGHILDSFHRYVRPTRPVPQKISELTGILDADVRDAPLLEEALPAFFAFAGDRPLIAHNAGFDVSFLRAGCEKLGIQRTFCYLDTVELARALLPELKNHKLNTVASAFRLSFEHHRADEDTQVLAEIWFRFCKILKERANIHTFAQIDDAAARLRGGDGGAQKSWHTIILARNREGLVTLYRLISDSFLKHYAGKNPIIPMSALQAEREHLIIGSACEAGELYRAVLEARPWGELMKLADFFDYLEIQPLGNNAFLLREQTVRDEEQLKDINRTILRLGDTLGKPVCATGDVHFLTPEDAVYREILMTSKGFDDAQFQAPLYYRTTGEMLSEFSYLGRERAYDVVIKNPNLISDLCEEIQPVLDGTYPPSIENSARDIEELARKRVMELYAVDGKLPDIVSERLESELRPIISHGFDVMYITAQKLVKKSNDAGYLVGSRGSVGSSFVAYLTGITEVNALQPHYRCPECRHSIFGLDAKYQTGVDLPDKICPVCGAPMEKDGFNILFATFLGFNADKAPDIDLNFSGEYQMQAHRDCIELFGEGNVYKAGTIGTVKERTAYGYVMKYLEQKGMTAGNAEKNRLAAGCSGVKRTTGQHPGGLIVVPKGRSIYEFTPVQHPADDPDSDIVTTHFDFHSIHDNLLKLDLLGHDVPTIIRKLQDLSHIDPQNVPLDDPETMRIFTDIAPLGIETDDILELTGAAAIPEFGTKFVRGMLVETQPTTFDGLVRISGLAHGTNVWLNNAQDLVHSGTATLNDIICCRDDITIHLMDMGLAPKLAFTISEGVRKGKGLKPEWEEELRAHNLPDWYIDSCKKILYLFPRAHAVAYTMMSYRIAWFKVHRPMEFYAVYFGNKLEAFEIETVAKGDAAVCKRYRELREMSKRTAAEDDIMTSLEICHECMKRGIKFSGVDIIRSGVRWFRIDGDTLIPPLMAVPGLGEAAAQSILEQREIEPFLSVEELGIRCDKVSRAHIEGLERAGALESLPKSSQLDLFGALGL